MMLHQFFHEDLEVNKVNTCKIIAKHITQTVCLFVSLFIYRITPKLLYGW